MNQGDTISFAVGIVQGFYSFLGRHCYMPDKGSRTKDIMGDAHEIWGRGKSIIWICWICISMQLRDLNNLRFGTYEDKVMEVYTNHNQPTIETE